jgi:cysteine-dependent adenosine diphosphate thiazole synthase
MARRAIDVADGKLQFSTWE